MGSVTVALPNVAKMGQLLTKVTFDPVVDREKFIVILTKYAGRRLTSRGIVNMLQEAIIKNGPVGEPPSYEPLTDSFKDIIEVLVVDKQVLNDALKDLSGRSYM